MSGLIPTTKNGNSKTASLGYNMLPGFPSWIDEVINKNFGTEFMSNFNTGITLPAVNVLDTANDYLVEMAVPGLKKSDFDINIDNHVLSISAEVKSEYEDVENESFTRREFGYSSFKRTFTLPESVETDKISAKYEDGILKVTLPKREEAKKKPLKNIKVS
ncbi:MAG: Hsp20/alpha crystallin family protein [Flavobacteriaceae bacterium]|nr:Hsp20/alpha crystallin family protein [Flavobacteriaceae bacterium]